MKNLNHDLIYGPFLWGVPIFPSVVVLALRGVCRCVCRGQVAQQLEWVLLDAHFALLQSLTLQPPTAGKQLWVARRCQALSALIRLTTIAPCQELLNMQEKVSRLLAQESFINHLPQESWSCGAAVSAGCYSYSISTFINLSSKLTSENHAALHDQSW